MPGEQNNPPKPKSNSLKNDITRIFKTTAKGLLFDDFNSKNQFNFEGNFRSSKSSVQIKSNLKFDCKSTVPTFNRTDETRLDFTLNNNNTLRLKTKPGSFTTHLDFDHYFMKPTLGDYSADLWVNPYVLLDGTRELENLNLSVGARFDVNSGLLTDDYRVQLRKEDGRLEGSFTGNHKIKYGGFTCNSLYSANLRSIATVTNRKCNLEYAKDKWSIGGEFERKGTFSDARYWFDNMGLGVAYKHCNRLMMGLWSQTNLNNGKTVVSAGLQKDLKDGVFVKARVDNNKDFELLGSFKCGGSLSYQMSMMSSIDSKRTSELYGNMAKLGFKVKFDN